MVDVAREQSPTRDHLFQFAQAAERGGYTGLGLYLEHRFAYPRNPWVAGRGALTPQLVHDLESEFPSLQIIPFVNVLAHVEGFLFTEEGRTMYEQLFKGLQACPCKPEFQKLAQNIIDDTMDVFRSEMIHIGGDETWQLAKCPECQKLSEGQPDPKAYVYAHHFAPLIQRVVERGRIPAVWGDMMFEHPQIAEILPKDAVVFDWQYFNGLKESTPKLQSHGFKVVGAPTLQTYNAAWMHTDSTEDNIREVAQDAVNLGCDGVCVTTWELGLFGSYDTLLPAIEWAGRVLQDPARSETLVEAYGADQKWADLLGRELEKLGGIFKQSGQRSSLKCRLLLYGNPFLLWMHHGEELSGDSGKQAIEICNKALQSTDDEAMKGIAVFVRSAIEFAQMAETAHRHYAQREAEKAVAALAPTRYLFDTLEKVARATHQRIGGSLADIERCRVAKAHVERVIQRIRDYGKGELGYLPSFEALTNVRFMPHDQACWWRVNDWANE